jgi:hypothetical protein
VRGWLSKNCTLQFVTWPWFFTCAEAGDGLVVALLFSIKVILYCSGEARDMECRRSSSFGPGGVCNSCQKFWCKSCGVSVGHTWVCQVDI